MGAWNQNVYNNTAKAEYSGKAVRYAAFLAALLYCLSPLATPPAALALGIIMALTIGNPDISRTRKASGLLLKSCVVLLGFSMNLAIVLHAGENGLLFAMGTIASTLLLGYLLGCWFKVPRSAATLIAAGTAICGGSAIAAVGTVISAEESDITVAMGSVFLLNSAALFLFPMAGSWLHLNAVQYGTWCGVSIHDISSVVGAASRRGLLALQTATAVKLSRALWIAPVALTAARFQHKKNGGRTQVSKVQWPWFIGLFLLASVARTLLPGMAACAPAIGSIASTGLTLTLFLIGLGLSRQTLRKVGWRPFAQAIVLWGFISISSLLIIVYLMH